MKFATIDDVLEHLQQQRAAVGGSAVVVLSEDETLPLDGQYVDLSAFLAGFGPKPENKDDFFDRQRQARELAAGWGQALDHLDVPAARPGGRA